MLSVIQRDTSSTPVARIENVSPEMALAWLEDTPTFQNRPVRQSRVNRWARAMKEGRWIVSNDAITFDTMGRLVNGQHRLWAVVESGVTCPFLVIRNAHKDVAIIGDTGASRTAGDVLAMNGFTHSSWIASGIRNVLSYERHGVMGITGTRVNNIDNDEILDWALTNRPMIDSAIENVSSYTGGKQVMYLPGGQVFALYVMTLEAYPAQIKQFFSRLRHGEDLSSGNPILTLRNKAIKIQAETGRPGVKRPSQTYMAVLLIKAWNAWISGRELHALVWRDSEKEPSIIGYGLDE